MSRYAGGEAEHLRVLTQPGVDVTLDQRSLAIEARGLAMRNPYAANLVLDGLGDEIPELFTCLFYRKTVQIKAAFEGDLSGFQFAYLRILDAIPSPIEFVLSANVDDELIGQAVDAGLFA